MTKKQMKNKIDSEINKAIICVTNCLKAKGYLLDESKWDKKCKEIRDYIHYLSDGDLSVAYVFIEGYSSTMQDDDFLTENGLLVKTA